MQFLDKYWYPVETIKGKWFTNFIRLLIHTRKIKKGIWKDEKLPHSCFSNRRICCSATKEICRNMQIEKRKSDDDYVVKENGQQIGIIYLCVDEWRFSTDFNDFSADSLSAIVSFMNELNNAKK